jgi:hypothetical protein
MAGTRSGHGALLTPFVGTDEFRRSAEQGEELAAFHIELVLPLIASPASACHPASLIFTRAASIAACDHALGVRGREPGAHQLDQQLGRKSVREH